MRNQDLLVMGKVLEVHNTADGDGEALAVAKLFEPVHLQRWKQIANCLDAYHLYKSPFPSSLTN